MFISGIQKTSLVDYPGNICDALFFGGCNLRCPYCHNPDLVLGSANLPRYELGDVINSLANRSRFIDGVCVSGGEPTLQPLPELKLFFSEIKALGLAVKLDTNGTQPEVLEELLQDGLVDYVAMDVKAPLSRYSEVCRVPVDLRAVRSSVDLLLKGEVEYEFRTTVPRSLLTESDLLEIGQWLSGARRYVLQAYQPTRRLDPSFNSNEADTESWLLSMQQRLIPYFSDVQVRGLRMEVVKS